MVPNSLFNICCNARSVQRNMEGNKIHGNLKLMTFECGHRNSSMGSNLLIFIKPTIIRDDDALDGATAAKYRYIRAQQQMRIDAGVEFTDDEEIPVLPEWGEQIRQLEQIKQESINGGTVTTGEGG